MTVQLSTELPPCRSTMRSDSFASLGLKLSGIHLITMIPLPSSQVLNARQASTDHGGYLCAASSQVDHKRTVHSPSPRQVQTTVYIHHLLDMRPILDFRLGLTGLFDSILTVWNTRSVLCSFLKFPCRQCDHLCSWHHRVQIGSSSNLAKLCILDTL